MKATKYLSRWFSISVCLAMLLGLLPMQLASAASPDIVISQVYGGGGNTGAPYTNDYVELFNRGTTAVSLSGWSIQYTSATGTGAFGANSGQLTELPSVTLQPGQYFLVQEAAGTSCSSSPCGVALPAPDSLDATPINMSGTGGKVALVMSTLSLGCNGSSTACSPSQLSLIKDLIGYGGANFFEGSGAAPSTSNTTAAFRINSGCTDTDNNANDFIVPVSGPAPRNTASPLSSCGADAAPSVSSTTPANGATQVALNSNLDIVFSEAVNVTGDWFDLTCGTSGLHAAVVTGGPTTFTLDPDADFALGESCTLTVNAANVNDQDTNDPPDYMVTNFTASFTAYVDVCTLIFTPIYSIQGSGLSAAITGNVTTQGVVVGDFETSASLSGFYMQDLNGDGDPATSDGIFVYTGSNNFVSTGQVVRVTGYARERFNQTALNGSNGNSSVVPAGNIINCGNGSVAPVDVTMPFESLTTPESYEGMLVKFPQALVISEYFNYDRFGEIVLALPLEGESRAFTPTSIDEPGVSAIARAYQNSLRRITLDDVQSAQNPATLRHPNGQPFSLTNLFRGGDLVQNAIGVLGYDFSLYRIMPTGPADYTEVNPRPQAPEAVGGSLQIAAMNTLNYFLTLDYPTGNPLDNKCGPLQNVECRGADSDQPLEFTRQRTKLLAALSGLNAAVIGLNEMENTLGVEPLADIVAGLNAMLGEGTYAYINTGVIGTDAIRVGMIYQPGLVTPIGDFQVLTTAVDPRFLDNYNRPALAQTFEENSTGARFTVVVNHLKSKGSDCIANGDPDIGDGQGNCNLTRWAAAQALVDWLATDPTGSSDPDFIIMGDLNSYAMEDPIKAILAGPDDIISTTDDYTNLIFQYQGAYAYSYVFDGQNGYLDHALANAGMASQVTGVTDWHINADEPDVLDYDTSFKPSAVDALYEPNAYRTSDHDAVLVGLGLLNLPPTVEAGGPYATSVNTSVLVSALGYDPEGTPLSYAWDLDYDGSFETFGQDVLYQAGTTTGIYPIQVQVTDIGGLTAVDQAVVAIFDLAGPFVTGGGWIDSLDGKGEFSFDAKYAKNNPLPVGTVDYMIESAGLYFAATGFDWLVVDGETAWLRGTGMFNGADGYSFMVTAVDGNDAFRIQIWELASGLLEYDSQPGDAEFAPATTLLGGGKIMIHYLGKTNL